MPKGRSVKPDLSGSCEMQTQAIKMFTLAMFTTGRWRTGSNIDVGRELTVEIYYETSFNRVANNEEYRSYENQVIFLLLSDESLSTQNNTCHIIGIWFY